MSKKKTIAVTVIAIVVVVGAALFVFAAKTNMFLTGDYYVRVDNACITQNDSRGGVINLRSSEPYLYKLEAVNATGETAEIEFGTSKELRQDAYLKLELQPVRGVVGWAEVPADEIPLKASEALG